MRKVRTGMTLGAAQIEAALAKKFGAPQYAFMPQMANGTGFAANRHADAVAFSLWPSRGLDLNGFEIKVSKSDLRRELLLPEKAEAIQKYCDFWWLVTPQGLCDGEVIPPTWGIIESDARCTLRVTKQAPKLDAAPLDRRILAAMFRGFALTIPYLQDNYVSLDEIEDEVKRRADIESGHQIHALRREHNELREAVREFEEHSKITITDKWRSGPIGDVVRIIMQAGGPWKFNVTLRDEAMRLRDALTAVEAALKVFEDSKPRPASDSEPQPSEQTA